MFEFYPQGLFKSSNVLLLEHLKFSRQNLKGDWFNNIVFAIIYDDYV